VSDTIVMLRLEHDNMARILDLIDAQVQHLESGAPVDEELLLLSIEYLRGFPEECHHPKEDLVFRKLERRAPERAAAISELCADHERLAALTEEFAGSVKRALDAPREALPLSILRYVGAYRNHIAMEERHFLPAALDALTGEDFAELDFDLFDRRDPLFDAAAEARFARLRRDIVSQGESGST
jgi:hemerythrin-like domain-containing protein